MGDSHSSTVSAASAASNNVDFTEFTKTLGEVLHRPTVFPMPAFAVKLAFGEMGESLLLGSQRVAPRRLQESGYEFKFPDLKSVLEVAVRWQSSTSRAK